MGGFARENDARVMSGAGQTNSAVPSNASSLSSETVDLSSRLLARLRDLRMRLDGIGEPSSPDKASAPIPNVVLAMVGTTHSNLLVAHKVLEDIEQLIG